MDNNFNQQQASGQPVYQQQMPTGQAPQQQMYQQQMPTGQMPTQQMPTQQMPAQQMPAQQMYQQPVYQQAPKKPSNTNTKELLALILSAVGTVMAVLGSILTCSCSATKTWDADDVLSMGMNVLSGDVHSTSAVMIVAILGAIVAGVGLVFGVLAIKDKNATVKAGKMAYIAVALGVFGVMYGILPVLTICGYNCSLDSKMNSAIGSSLSGLLN